MEPKKDDLVEEILRLLQEELEESKEGPEIMKRKKVEAPSLREEEPEYTPEEVTESEELIDEEIENDPELKILVEFWRQNGFTEKEIEEGIDEWKYGDGTYPPDEVEAIRKWVKTHHDGEGII